LGQASIADSSANFASALLPRSRCHAPRPADAKFLALGQYLHLAQDMFFHQDAKTGKPFGAGTDTLAHELDHARAADRAVADNGAIMFTYQTAKAFNQTGSLPPLPPADKFDSVFYAPVSANERARSRARQSPETWPRRAAV
jgi:hypothetical protein